MRKSAVRAVDIDIPDFVARTNETGSIVYDYTHVNRDILWTLTNQDAGTNIETAFTTRLYNFRPIILGDVPSPP